MQKTPKAVSQKAPSNFKKSASAETYGLIYHQAFNNAAQANIISNFVTGKIMIVNAAACKLLGYSKKELLTKSRSGIFEINETSFKKGIHRVTANGKSVCSVKSLKKNGKSFLSDITSAIFIDENGVEKIITTIFDKSQQIVDQNNIDTERDKKVSDDIVLAKEKQNVIDIKRDEKDVKNIMLAKNKQANIDIKKDKQVAGDIVKAISKQQVIDTKNQKIVDNNIVIAEAKSNAVLIANNQWIKHVAKSSYDIMWDWDIASGNIYVGESVQEIFGYRLKMNCVSFAKFIRCIVPEEKGRVLKKINKVLASKSKSWKDSYMIIRLDGSIASTISRASIVRDAKGKAINLIGAVKDISEVHELEDKLKEQAIRKKEHRNIIKLATKLSYDGIWDWNIVTNNFYLSEGFEKLFGFSFGNVKDGSFNWSDFLHPEDRDAVIDNMQKALASTSTHWEMAYRFIKDDGTIANVFGRASIIRDEQGTAARMIGVIHDISNQKLLEEKLAEEIRLKDLQIAEAAEYAKENERSDIGKELHDNVNQLLGASKLYMDMAKRGGDEAAIYLSRSSEYTMTAIEEIRKLTKGLTTDIIKDLGLGPAIKNLTDDISEVSPIKISCSIKNFIEDSVNDKFKLNIFRIIQEQVTNIIKHAKASKLTISLLQNNNTVILGISDNGVGFNVDEEKEGIGVANIKSRVATYNGTINIISKPDKGCTIHINFPITELMLK